MAALLHVQMRQQKIRPGRIVWKLHCSGTSVQTVVDPASGTWIPAVPWMAFQCPEYCIEYCIYGIDLRKDVCRAGWQDRKRRAGAWMCVRIPADRCSIQILMHEINHYQMKGAVVRCDYGSSFFSVLFFRTQKFQAGQPGIFALKCI